MVLVWFFFKFKLKKKTKMGYEKSAPQSFVVPRYPTPRGFTKSGRRKLGPDLFVVSCYASLLFLFLLFSSLLLREKHFFLRSLLLVSSVRDIYLMHSAKFREVRNAFIVDVFLV